MKNDETTDRHELARSLNMTLEELAAEERAIRDWYRFACPLEIGEFSFAIRQELRRRWALMN